MKHRIERLNSLIKEELSKMMLKELELPALVTLTEVATAANLSVAKIKCSVLPSDKSGAVLTILKHNAPHLQYLLMKQLNIKPTPKIYFEIDYGVEEAAKIEKALLGDLKKSQN